MGSDDRQTHLREEHVYLADVRCGARSRGWSEVRPAPVFGLVLVRHGLLRVRTEGAEYLVDRASVYVEQLGREQQFAHPRGADVFTEVVLSEPRVAAMLGDDPEIPEGLVITTPRLALAHRLLLSRARAGADPFELAERTTLLAHGVFAQLAPVRASSGRPGSPVARRRLADDVRAFLATDPGAGLETLARAVGVSPPHLSRTFTEITGVTLTAYRHRLQLAAALDRLGQGERDLALLANDLGFSDQAHMTRVLRATAGLPPGRLRTLLTSPAGTPRTEPADRRDAGPGSPPGG
ncbi:helix-turn-helix domain-containing protein [Streptomyces palmae]|uniref:helix-turn-helix domain-containing protein n=1 Tax=Streptomyces palmae TaxID=1701085 RepID=UPI001FD76A5E|nr:AraC family transcriptional regulator [Streptomyces palmae]